MKLGHVTSTGGADHWRTAARSGHHDLEIDEPAPEGADAAPNPFAYLLVGLCGCTNITLRMYAERKGWPLEEVGVDCTYVREGEKDDAVDHIDRVLRLRGALDDEQRARLADIAERTPMTIVVKRGTEVRTALA